MANDIDKLLRIARDGRPLRLRPVRLTTVFANVLRDLRALIVVTNAKIEMSPEYPVVAAERLLLEQLFMNLLSNALLYTHPDRPSVVRIKAKVKDCIATVAVKDNGLGIDPERLEQIFKPHPRRGARMGTATTAVGLAIAKRAAELHGGSIAVQSVPGVGSTFCVRLNVPRRARD